jgi:DME family drug/metabolite transporter
MHESITGAIMVLLSGVCWGTYGTIASFLPKTISSLTVGALRLGIGALGIACVLALTHRGRVFTRGIRFSKRNLLVGAVALAVAQATLYLGIRTAGVTIATMIFIGTPPLFSGVYAQLVKRERQSVSWLVSSIIIAAGCALMALSEQTIEGVGSRLLLGSLFALTAGAGWTIVGTMLRNMQSVASPLESACAVMGASSLFMLPFALVGDLSWAREPNSLILVLALGLLSSAIPYWLFTTGARKIPASHAFLYGLTEPITASFLGILILQERLRGIGALGYSAVVAGLLLFSTWEMRKATNRRTATTGSSQDSSAS